MEEDGVEYYVHGDHPEELDQYFTKPKVVVQCLEFLDKHYKLGDFDLVIEPSSGNNDFVKVLNQTVPLEKMIWMDIDAIDPNHRENFLVWSLPKQFEGKNVLTIGNPPFGKNSSKAISFFNHAALFSNVIAFIVAKTFRKKSYKNRLFCTFEMVAELTLDSNSFVFNGEDYILECVFQIWKKTDTPRQSYPSRSETQDFVFVKADRPYDFVVRRVGVNAGRLFTNLEETYSANSHLFIHVKDPKNKDAVLERLKSLELETCETKFDTAGNPSLSGTEICDMYDGNFETSTSSSSEEEGGKLKRIKLE